MLLRVRCDAVNCSRVDPAFVTNYIPKLYFEEALNLTNAKLLVSSDLRIFTTTYKDSLFSIPSSDMSIFSMWTIPVNAQKSPKSNFNSTGDVIKTTGA
jgi:hypothetical protein